MSAARATIRRDEDGAWWTRCKCGSVAWFPTFDRAIKRASMHVGLWHR